MEMLFLIVINPTVPVLYKYSSGSFKLTTSLLLFALLY